MQAAVVNTEVLKISNKEIERANDVLAYTLIKKLFEEGKISRKVFLNIQKDINIRVES